MPLIPEKSERQSDESKFNKNFFAFITSTIHDNVVARLPEEVPITISSEWEAPIAGAFSGLRGKIADFTLRETTGVTLKNQLFTSQIWSGSSPIEMTIPLEFYADRDPLREVLLPIIALSKMALPRYNNTELTDKANRSIQKAIDELGITAKNLELKPLTAPGPLIFDAETSEVKSDEITIQLGEFLLFKRVIITNVDMNFNTRDLVKEGKPLRASCEVTFRTIQSLTGEDFAGMFLS